MTYALSNGEAKHDQLEFWTAILNLCDVKYKSFALSNIRIVREENARFCFI